ncbi:MAG: glycosyltransferase family 4 protein, partial [Thermoproteota archaeon]
GIHFHGIEKGFDFKAFSSILKSLMTYPLISIVRKPPLVYQENLYVANILRVMKNNNVDLIHSHFAHYEGLVGLLVKKRTRRPLVVTVHGHDILIEPSVRYGARLSKRINIIVKRVLNEADAIIAASTATFIEACKIVHSADKVHLIPNGVDTNKFRPDIDSSHLKRVLNIRDETTVVFTLRSHEPQYGIEYLIKAIPLVLKGERDILFIIGGDGSLRQYHEELVQKLGVKEKVIFTGRISRNEVPYYYAMSDIVVVPSLQEAFGLVISEAMSSGKPVIGSKVGGIPDQIIHGYNGFLVQPRNPEEIAEKIVWLIENPEKAKQMGRNGRILAEEKFNIDRRIDRIIQLYKEVLRKY